MHFPCHQCLAWSEWVPFIAHILSKVDFLFSCLFRQFAPLMKLSSAPILILYPLLIITWAMHFKHLFYLNYWFLWGVYCLCHWATITTFLFWFFVPISCFISSKLSDSTFLSCFGVLCFPLTALPSFLASISSLTKSFSILHLILRSISFSSDHEIDYFLPGTSIEPKVSFKASLFALKVHKFIFTEVTSSHMPDRVQCLAHAIGSFDYWYCF